MGKHLVDIIAQWEEDHMMASVINQHLVCDPTIRKPGFDLPRQTWTVLNRFRTGKGLCRAYLHKWGLVTSDLCNCGHQ